MYSSKAMWRAMAPYFAIAMIPSAAAGIIYALEGPIWVIYVAIAVGAVPVLIGEERWERRRSGPPGDQAFE